MLGVGAGECRPCDPDRGVEVEFPGRLEKEPRHLQPWRGSRVVQVARSSRLRGHPRTHRLHQGRAAVHVARLRRRQGSAQGRRLLGLPRGQECAEARTSSTSRSIPEMERRSLTLSCRGVTAPNHFTTVASGATMPPMPAHVPDLSTSPMSLRRHSRTRPCARRAGCSHRESGAVRAAPSPGTDDEDDDDGREPTTPITHTLSGSALTRRRSAGGSCVVRSRARRAGTARVARFALRCSSGGS